MSKTLLMSIKPKYAQKIYRGEKFTEIRKSFPDLRPCDTVFIYETSPMKAITGLFTVEYISQHRCPENYKEYACKYGGVTEEEYLDYVKGANKVVFIDIRHVKMTNIVHLEKLNQLEGFTVPVSYRYLKEDEIIPITKLMAGGNGYWGLLYGPAKNMKEELGGLINENRSRPFA